MLHHYHFQFIVCLNQFADFDSALLFHFTFIHVLNSKFINSMNHLFFIILHFINFLRRYFAIFIYFGWRLFSTFFLFFNKNLFLISLSTWRKHEFIYIQVWNLIWISIWSNYHNMASSKSCLKDLFILKHQWIYQVRSEFIFIF